MVVLLAETSVHHQKLQKWLAFQQLLYRKQHDNGPSGPYKQILAS